MFFSNLFSSRQPKESSTTPSTSGPPQATVGCANSRQDDPLPGQNHERAEGLANMGSNASMQQSLPDTGFDASLPHGVSSGTSAGGTGSAATATLLPSNLTLPTTLSIPLDGYCVSVELAPTGTIPQPGAGHNGTNGCAVNGLQVHIAQQMLAFATQQATLLQQVRKGLAASGPLLVVCHITQHISEQQGNRMPQGVGLA